MKSKNKKKIFKYYKVKPKLWKLLYKKEINRKKTLTLKSKFYKKSYSRSNKTSNKKLIKF